MNSLESQYDFIVDSIASSRTMELVSIDASAKTVKYYDVANDALLSFRGTAHTQTSLEDLIYFGTSLYNDAVPAWKATIANTLLHLDPEVLCTLQAIFIIGDYEDLVDISEMLETSLASLPKDLWVDEDDNDLSTTLLGLNWGQYSSVFVNIHAINQYVDTLTMDEMPGSEKARKIREGVFWTTLFHEIRHAQQNCCPFPLPWMSEVESYEESVEQWGKDIYQTLRTQGKL